MCHLVWKGICECRDCPLDLRDGSDLRGLIGKCLCQYFGFHARTDLAHVDVERQTGAVFTVRKSCARMLVCIQNRANSDIWPGLGGEKKKTPAFFFSISLFLSLHFRAIITTTFIIHLAPTVWFAPWKGANAQLEALLHRCQSPYTCRGRAFCCAIHNSECIKAKTLTCRHCELEGSYTPRRSILFF